MRRKLLICGVAMLVGVFSASIAGARNMAFEVNGGAAIPVSDLGDMAGVGGGADVGVFFELGEKWYGKLGVGYHKFSSETLGGRDISGGFIPIKIGVVKFWDEGKRFYTTPTVGIYLGTGDFDGDFTPVTIKDGTNFGIGPKVGYLFRYGDGNRSVDVGLEFQTIFSDPAKSYYLTASVGLSFGIISQY
jgi:hypothetical protein